VSNLDASEEYRQLAELLPDDFSNPMDTLDEVRAKFELVHGHDPGPGVHVEEVRDGVWVRPADRDGPRPTVFFVHGGGFVTSPAASYAFYGANIVRACSTDVLVAEYRLAPETTHPGQLEDLVAAYERLIGDHEPSSIVFMGDSCGGGMALAALVVARDRGLPLPAAFVGLCGWFDLEATGESAVSPIGRDPLLNVDWLRLRGGDYVGTEGDLAAPTASPLHADLSGLPPALLHAGAVDRCRSDAERVGAKIIEAGGSAEVKIWSGMPHGFHGLVGVIPEAEEAFGEVNAFLARVIANRRGR
jgi:monoterpene epsilon-lactone hydrolase